MNIFVTLDRNYLPPLRTMLYSLFANNPGERFDVYAAADGLTAQDWQDLNTLAARYDSKIISIPIKDEWFTSAPTVRYYSRAMYYRLLAAQILPQELDRILYLDPDILVINPVRALYDVPMGDRLFAAAMHRGLTGISGTISRIRLPNYEADEYYNSGVLMMNLVRLREEISPKDIFDYTEKYRMALILPDQDILNGLYASRILPVDEVLWNYDARKYESYRLASQGEANLDWVIANTSIIHFCGKEKPWQKSCRSRFAALYKHYMHRTPSAS